MKVILLIDCCSGLVRGISPKCSKFKIYRNLGVSLNAILNHQMISPPPQKRSRLLRALIFHRFLLRPAILDLFKVDFTFYHGKSRFFTTHHLGNILCLFFPGTEQANLRVFKLKPLFLRGGGQVARQTAQV